MKNYKILFAILHLPTVTAIVLIIVIEITIFIKSINFDIIIINL